MISNTILKRYFSSHIKIIGIFIAILLMYELILVYMYSPEMIESLNESTEAMGAIGSIKGFNNLSGGFTGYLGEMYFGMIVPMFLLVFNVIVGCKIFAGNIEKGSIFTLLVSPNSRNKIFMTSSLFIILSNFFIVFATSIIGYIACLTYSEADISFLNFWGLVFGAWIMISAVGVISMFFSAISSTYSRALVTGGGIPIVLFIFILLSEMTPDLAVFKKISIFSLYSPSNLICDDYFLYLIKLLTLVLMSAILIFISRKVFINKDICV